MNTASSIDATRASTVCETGWKLTTTAAGALLFLAVALALDEAANQLYIANANSDSQLVTRTSFPLLRAAITWGPWYAVS
jgi:hypothetical protein